MKKLLLSIIMTVSVASPFNAYANSDMQNANNASELMNTVVSEVLKKQVPKDLNVNQTQKNCIAKHKTSHQDWQSAINNQFTSSELKAFNQYLGEPVIQRVMKNAILASLDQSSSASNDGINYADLEKMTQADKDRFLELLEKFFGIIDSSDGNEVIAKQYINILNECNLWGSVLAQ